LNPTHYKYGEKQPALYARRFPGIAPFKSSATIDPDAVCFEVN